MLEFESEDEKRARDHAEYIEVTEYFRETDIYLSGVDIEETDYLGIMIQFPEDDAEKLKADFNESAIVKNRTLNIKEKIDIMADLLKAAAARM